MSTQFFGPPKYLPSVGKLIYDSDVTPPGEAETIAMLLCLNDLGIDPQQIEIYTSALHSAFRGGNYDRYDDLRGYVIDTINVATYDLTHISTGELRFGIMISDDYATRQWYRRWGWFDPRQWRWYGFKEVVGYYARGPRNATT